MSPNNRSPAKPAGKDETQNSTGRKTSAAANRPQEPAPKCPRCDSPNTKFCYYNNYSLTQPRHFCKTCRRYWTKGGALRNVPIGGGCRKNKKMKSCQRLSGGGDSKDHSSSSSDISGLKFFQGVSPAMDFQLGGINIPRFHQAPNPTSMFNQFSPFGDVSMTSGAITSGHCFSLDPTTASSSPLMGFGFPSSSGNTPNPFQEMGSLNVNNSLASSIECLSSINQDLHWKLQQQRLATLFVGENQKDINNNNNNQNTLSIPNSSVEPLVQKPQPILFQNLDISKADSCGRDGNLSTEWFFDNSNYGNPTPATSSSNLNENTSSWNGFQAWSDLTQYTALP